jgi:predicted TIM-barrel fold metal-dependent hydrolase
MFALPDRNDSPISSCCAAISASQIEKENLMKIDIFCHIFPQEFYNRMLKATEKGSSIKKRATGIPSIVDLDVRFRIMDRFGEYTQVVSLAAPPIEALGDAKHSPELAQIANDGLAEIVAKYPDRFPGFVAALPLNNPEASVLEMAEFNLPIWLHPSRASSFPDYQTETKSKYEMWWVFGWPYETSVAMARILFAGYFDRFPNLKIITHHLGAMVPYFSGRTGPGLDQLGSRTEEEDLTVYARRLKKRPQEYFKMFYADTATFGSRPALQCGLEFFGADQVLFASDSPFDPEKGPGYIRETIRCIEEVPLSAEDRAKIYEGNARRMLRLKLA